MTTSQVAVKILKEVFVRKLLLLFVCLVLSSCASVHAVYTPYRGYTEEGIASWYGAKFHGRRTSSGEIYNMYAHTAAHKTLPLGTTVKVKNLNNQKQTVVRINDRGPFVEGRIIDLSYSAARDIDMVSTGTAPVRITVLYPTEVYKAMKKELFTVQVGSFSSYTYALLLKRKIDKHFPYVYLKKFFDGQNVYWRVRVGKYNDRGSADICSAKLRQLGFPTFITASD
ncbi:MAG: septal ring lytic transglycosylase RlpA family protein [Deltaproteobacteria bacterium]|nr:septal ring lytic transglycosylase RlpA family protein [Deltaproteobacteria bacterium]